MTLGTWLTVGTVLAAIAVGLISIIVRYVLGLPKWRDVPLPGFTIKVAGSVSDTEVADAVLLAVEAVTEVFGQDAVLVAVEHVGLRVLVMETESWLNAANVRVGGEQMKNTLVVGPSLSALAHEMIHYMHWALEGGEDADHAHWDMRIWRADARYRQALKER